jgi:hypothetical protein
MDRQKGKAMTAENGLNCLLGIRIGTRGKDDGGNQYSQVARNKEASSVGVELTGTSRLSR